MQDNDSWNMEKEDILQSRFAVHRACRDGDVNAVKAFLSDGEPSNIQVEDVFYAWTPAHWAAYFGKLACLRTLITDGSLPVDIKTSQFHQTPSHLTSFAGHPHCLRWLLQAGADINQQDYLGDTVLHKAARTGSVECMSLLISRSPHVQLMSRNNAGQTAAELADMCGYLDCGRYLRQVIHQQTQPSIASISTDTTSDTTSDTSTPQPVYEHQGNGDTSASMEMQVMTEESQGDVLMCEGVCRNSTGVAGVKRSREDEEDTCWKKIKLSHSMCSVCNDRARVNTVLLSYNAILSSSVKPMVLDPDITPLTNVAGSGRLFF